VSSLSFFSHLHLFLIVDVTGSDHPVFWKKIKVKFVNRNRVRTEEEGTSPGDVVVSNRENKRGVIKEFIVSSRSGLGT
jgi:hypothetical protein